MIKKVLITGGSKGIGLETAKLFLKNNFEVITCASTEASIIQMKKEYRDIHCFRCNMSVKSEVESFAAEINQKFSHIDVLINNVGKLRTGQLHKEDNAVFEDMMLTNLFGTYYLTKALLPKMIERRQGTIFNICSTASITPYINSGSYCVSKFALLGFSKVLREEMKPYNIRVISVLPGATLTGSWYGVNLPVERFIPAEDVAKVIFETNNLSSRTVVEEILIRPSEGDLGNITMESATHNKIN